MIFTVPKKVSEAPYSVDLAQEPAWANATEALNTVFTANGVIDSCEILYISFEFMDGDPKTIGKYTQPPSGAIDFPPSHDIDIFDVIRDSLCPTLSENPMHHALFRYKNEQWQAARVFDSYSATWDDWRALRSQLQQNRFAWFQTLAKKAFDSIYQINLFIMIDPETTMQEIIPLLIGLEDKTVWMMTNGFSDRVSPHAGKNWPDLPTCDSELLFRCSRSQLGEAPIQTLDVTNSLEIAAVTQLTEACYWQYIDGLADKKHDQVIDLSKPQRLKTLAVHTGKAQALEPSTPFLLTAFTQNGPINLAQGRQATPAMVTVEGALSSKFSPALTATVKRVTGGLGKAPKEYTGPSDADLFTQLREDISEHGSVKTPMLKKRMENLAVLDFYFDRYLPVDLAPYLEQMHLVEFGESNRRGTKKLVEEHGDLLSRHDTESTDSRPHLSSLMVYTELKSIDLRVSKISNFNWLESLESLEEILLNGAEISDFSQLSTASNLKRLDIGQTDLDTLSHVTPLHQLETLELFGVQINDVSPLATLSNLKRLQISHMPITDISCLAPLQNLEELLVAGNDIEDYSVLTSFPTLKLLSIAETTVSDLTVLPDMPNLETLYIWDCAKVTDLSPLERYPKLKPVNTKGTGVS